MDDLDAANLILSLHGSAREPMQIDPELLHGVKEEDVSMAPAPDPPFAPALLPPISTAGPKITLRIGNRDGMTNGK